MLSFTVLFHQAVCFVCPVFHVPHASLSAPTRVFLKTDHVSSAVSFVLFTPFSFLVTSISTSCWISSFWSFRRFICTLEILILDLGVLRLGVLAHRMTGRWSMFRPALGMAFASVAFLLCCVLVKMQSTWDDVLRSFHLYHVYV